MKKNISIGLIFVSCLFFSCDREDLTGVVTGNIFYIGTRIPIPEVIVGLDTWESVTNSRGEYFIRSSLGRYKLRADKDGFDSYSSTVKVVKGSTELDINMTSLEFTCIVFGVARGNHTGNPQRGLEILILNPDESDSEIISLTDSDGNFDLPYVPRGERMLVVRENGVVIYSELLILDDSEYLLEIYLPEPFSFTDYRDGNVYKALLISKQTWMIENLAWLPSVSGSHSGSSVDPYYYLLGYEGESIIDARNSNNYRKYGVFYNWEAAKTSCPGGWHLPSDDEWKTLELFLGMSSFDVDSDGGRLSGELGHKMKSTSGWINNGHGDNSSKFNVVPVGSRLDNGGFDSFGYRATMWTSTESSAVFAWSRGFAQNVSWVDRDRHNLQNGLSVRCIKNN